MDKFTAMGKLELRTACREAGISYGKLNNDGMRDALRAAAPAPEAPVTPVADPSTMSYDEVCNAACPGCGVHLSNGLLTQNDEAMSSKGNGVFATSTGRTLYEAGQLNFEYECMGCGHQFGAESAPYVKPAATRATGTGLKIEKVREERNGVKRPSAGGKCRAIWDALDAMANDDQDGDGALGAANVTAAMVRNLAADENWNPNNASIEFYQWRKFNGIAGRS